MEQRLTILTLGVRDLEISTRFYEEQFGWKKMASSNEDITFFQLNGILLSLYSSKKLAEDAGVNSSGEGFKCFTIAFNARSEEEVDQIFYKMRSRQVKIVKEPEKVFWGGYSGYIADPDDNLWEIAYNPFLKMDKNGNAESA